MAETSPIMTSPVNEQSFRRWWFIFGAILVVLVGASVVLVIAGPSDRVANPRSFLVPSSSMEPTIVKGDRILADMDYYRTHKPQDGDVVLYERNHTIFIKRIIASAGETIRGTGGAVYLEGKLLSEPYAQHAGNAPEWLNEFGPIPVPADNYFVMGDNRDLSLDSRAAEHGYVSADMIVGRPVRVLFNPRLGRFGKQVR